MNAISDAGEPGTTHHACASTRFGVAAANPGVASTLPPPAGSDARRSAPAGSTSSVRCFAASLRASAASAARDRAAGVRAVPGAAAETPAATATATSRSPVLSARLIGATLILRPPAPQITAPARTGRTGAAARTRPARPRSRRGATARSPRARRPTRDRRHTRGRFRGIVRGGRVTAAGPRPRTGRPAKTPARPESTTITPVGSKVRSGYVQAPPSTYAPRRRCGGATPIPADTGITYRKPNSSRCAP